MLRVACAIVVQDGKVLCTLRGPAMSLPGVWEFPGGKVEVGESDAACIVRELREELNIEIEVLESGPAVYHPLAGGQALALAPFVCRWVGGELRLLEHAETRWCAPEEMQRLEWAEADLGVLAWWQGVSDRFLV